MRKSTIEELSKFSKTGKNEEINQNAAQEYTNKKRKRTQKQNIYSNREEEKILKYALKISEKEYKLKLQMDENNFEIPQNYSSIEPAKIYTASEEEFLNPLALFDSLWNGEDKSTGIIKIIPPKKWVAEQKQNLENNYKSALKDKSKKLNVRIQNLFELYKAKVIIFHNILFY